VATQANRMDGRPADSMGPRPVAGTQTKNLPLGLADGPPGLVTGPGLVRDTAADYPLQDGAQESGAGVPALGFAVAQLHGIYILAETAAGLVMVDAHAAHERVTYERLKASIRQSAVQSQALLLPISLSVTESEAERAVHTTGYWSVAGSICCAPGPTA
jgi:DNA mismatch repair protein MutL